MLAVYGATRDELEQLVHSSDYHISLVNGPKAFGNLIVNCCMLTYSREFKL